MFALVYMASWARRPHLAPNPLVLSLRRGLRGPGTQGVASEKGFLPKSKDV